MHQKFISVGIAVFSICLPLPARAASFLNEITGIYAFGDSLTDTGNVLSATGFPPLPYVDGRFSNGANWLDYLSQSLGLSNPTPVSKSSPAKAGINFAFGGATTGVDNTISPLLPGLQQQIGLFISPLKQTDRTADPKALYIVWAGANDYLPTESTTFSPYETPEVPVTQLSRAIATLASVGAKNILTVNLPDLGRAPLALGQNPPLSSNLSALTEAHNRQFSTALASLRQSLTAEVNLMAYDVNSVFDNALENPGTFGLSNTTEACLFVAACVGDRTGQTQQQYLFWDAIHPTTRGHEIIARGALVALRQGESVPEPRAIAGLIAFSVVALGTARNRKRA